MEIPSSCSTRGLDESDVQVLARKTCQLRRRFLRFEHNRTDIFPRHGLCKQAEVQRRINRFQFSQNCNCFLRDNRCVYIIQTCTRTCQSEMQSLSSLEKGFCAARDPTSEKRENELQPGWLIIMTPCPKSCGTYIHLTFGPKLK